MFCLGKDVRDKRWASVYDTASPSVNCPWGPVDISSHGKRTDLSVLQKEFFSAYSPEKMSGYFNLVMSCV